MDNKKITVPDLLEMKNKGRKITMLTAYDYPTALALEKAGIDIILVGDSLGNVILGYDSTIPVTMDEMIHHTKAVRRAVKNAFLIADMPFMSFQINSDQSIINAGRFIKEAGADAVKVEGAGNKTLAMIEAVIGAGIPVMGHVGLTPQTASTLGGLKVQGKTSQAAEEIIHQAVALERAGCFSLVLECVPDVLAELITSKLKIPTIGIGAGIGCDGQVLVTHDMLGLYDRFTPKFVKRYAELSKAIDSALKQYIKEVRDNIFPDAKHSFTMKNGEASKLKP